MAFVNGASSATPLVPNVTTAQGGAHDRTNVGADVPRPSLASGVGVSGVDQALPPSTAQAAAATVAAARLSDSPAAIERDLQGIATSIAAALAAADKSDPADGGFSCGHASVILSKIVEQLPIQTWVAQLIAVHKRIALLPRDGQTDLDALIDLKVDFNKVIATSVELYVWGGFGRFSYKEPGHIFAGCEELSLRRFSF